jgi:hypothetical protein
MAGVQSEELLLTLRRASDAYRELPGLRMALVAGSVARGVADGSSDLDLYLYFDHVDHRLVGATPLLTSPDTSRLFGLPTSDGYFEKYRYGDRLLDVECVNLRALQRAVEQLSGAEAPAAWSVKIAIGLRDALPLAGADELKLWQSRLAYSDRAAAAEVASRGGAIVAPSALFALTFERSDPLAFAARLSKLLLDVIALLAAANREFVPVDDPKWMPWHLARLRYAPERLVERLATGLREPTIASMEDLDALVLEVLDIVDDRVPDASTMTARYALELRSRP